MARPRNLVRRLARICARYWSDSTLLRPLLGGRGWTEEVFDMGDTRGAGGARRARLRARSPAQGRDIPSIAITAHYEDFPRPARATSRPISANRYRWKGSAARSPRCAVATRPAAVSGRPSPPRSDLASSCRHGRRTEVCQGKLFPILIAVPTGFTLSLGRVELRIPARGFAYAATWLIRAGRRRRPGPS